MMTQQTRELLEALKSSANQATAYNAPILLGERPNVDYKPDPEKCAADGHYGGFLQAVMTGDLLLVWQLADELNREAIRNLIPVEIRARY